MAAILQSLNPCPLSRCHLACPAVQDASGPKTSPNAAEEACVPNACTSLQSSSSHTRPESSIPNPSPSPLTTLGHEQGSARQRTVGRM
ncbi:hypothetical protein ACLKA6_003522 [Drosophila palustris]